MLTVLRPKVRALGALLLCGALATGCASRNSRPKPSRAIAMAAGYIDLQSGWRVRVVTPILKSGNYKLKALEETSGNTITLSTDSDFIGYETSFYAITGAYDSGIRLIFTSAEAIRDGKTSREPRPLVKLFDLPDDARYVRLLFLVRNSAADHDMAVIAAKDRAILDAATKRVQSKPALCTSEIEALCHWVPERIAVRPEMKTKGTWVPVL